MSKTTKILLLILVLVLCIVSDQTAKRIARETLAESGPISLLNDLVLFEYSENLGAFLGLGSNLPAYARTLLWIGFVSVVLAAATAVALQSSDMGSWQLIALSLIIGGGIGNLIDRIANKGAVIDFVSMGIGPLRTGIFNLADLAIMTGTTILFVWSVQAGRETKHTEKPEQTVQNPS